MPARTDTPFGHGVRLGRVRGIPITAHWSVLVVLVLLTTLLATTQLPLTHRGDHPAVYWLLGTGTAVLFLAALAAHELAHAVVARHYGMTVKRMTLWMLGGLTELDGEPPSPRADAWVAGAGPLVTLLLGGVFAALTWLTGVHSAVGNAFGWLATMSLVLAVFNLIPAAPLDGGRLLRAVIWRATGDRVRAAGVAASAGRVVGTLLIALGLFSVAAGDASGLWLALIGWFVLGGARSEQYAGRAERLAGLVAGDVMQPATVSSPQWWTVRTFLDSLDPHDAAQSAFPVVDVDGRAIGAITLADLERVPPTQVEQLRVDELRARRPAVPIVLRDAPLQQVVLAIHLRGHVAVVVDDSGRPIGIVDEQLLERATRVAALGPKPAPQR